MKKQRQISFNKFQKLFLLICMSVSWNMAGAQTWGSQSSGITDNVNSIYFVSEQVGYAAGDAGRIIKTTDGGRNWSILSSGISEDLYAIHFESASIGYAVGEDGVILVTINSGTSWTAKTSGTTEDLTSVTSPATGVVYAVGNGGVIVKSNDAGNSWASQTSNVTEDLNEVHFYNSSTGFAVGTGILNGTILVTFNGGANWTSQTSGVLTGLNSVYFSSTSRGYAVGQAGTILVTEDAGTNWDLVISGTVSNLNSVHFVNDSVGFAAGDAGVIVRTMDYGNTWTPLNSGTTANINSIFMVDEYNGYGGANGGALIRTCPTVDYSVSPNDTTCVGSTINFSNLSKNADTYLWTVNTDTVATTFNYLIMFDSAGTFTVSLIGDNGTCTSTFTETVTAYDAPEVDLGNDTAICSTCTITLDAGNTGSTYIWYRDGIVTGSTTQTINVGLSGDYSVRVTSPQGCEGSDHVIVSIATGVRNVKGATAMIIYPNPNKGQFTLTFNVDNNQDVKVRVVNTLGEVVYTETKTDFSGKYSETLDLSKFAAGTYMVQVIHNNTITTNSVVTFK